MSSTAASSSAPEQGFRRSAVILLGMLGAIQVADPILSSLALVKASDELNFSASTQSLAAGISTLALAATAIPGIYTTAFVSTISIIAVVVALAGITMYLLLKNKKASVPVEEYLGLTK